MLKFYYSLAPNPMKVALFLEETGTPYEAIPVDTRKGEQYEPGFLAINPNAKVPVIVDGDATVFDSTAILLYLGEKTGKFMPTNTPKARGQMLSWMSFISSGLGPFSGQAVHFKAYAPADNGYAKERYQFEAERHYGVLEQHLSNSKYMVGDTYTIADMNLWGWGRMANFVLGEDVAAKFKSVKRVVDEVAARPAAARALALKDRHAFKTENDAEARRHMFRHIKS